MAPCSSADLTSVSSCLGAYLGALLNEVLDADLPAARTPSSYLFAQVCGVFLRNDNEERYDGESQQDSTEYLQKLLDRLDVEELNGRTQDLDAPSIVRKLFGLEAVTKASRYSRCVR